MQGQEMMTQTKEQKAAPNSPVYGPDAPIEGEAGLAGRWRDVLSLIDLYDVFYLDTPIQPNEPSGRVPEAAPPARPTPALTPRR